MSFINRKILGIYYFHRFIHSITPEILGQNGSLPWWLFRGGSARPLIRIFSVWKRNFPGKTPSPAVRSVPWWKRSGTFSLGRSWNCSSLRLNCRSYSPGSWNRTSQNYCQKNLKTQSEKKIIIPVICCNIGQNRCLVNHNEMIALTWFLKIIWRQIQKHLKSHISKK